MTAVGGLLEDDRSADFTGIGQRLAGYERIVSRVEHECRNPDPRQRRSQIRRAVAREDDTEERVQLVGRAVGPDAHVELGDPRAVAERGLASVTAACVDPRQANGLIGGAGHADSLDE